jgi:hypothetical protein
MINKILNPIKNFLSTKTLEQQTKPIQKNPIVVSLSAGPGVGKSVAASRLYAELKMKGVNCELVTEYPKDLTWDQSYFLLGHQLSIFAEQHRRLWRLKNKVDVIISDSSMLLGLAYQEKRDQIYENYVVYEYNKFKHKNYFLIREGNYQSIGRNQTAEEAQEKDFQIKAIMDEYKIEYKLMNRDNIQEIVNEIINELDNKNS